MAPRLQQAGCNAPSYVTLLLANEDFQNTIIHDTDMETLYWVETSNDVPQRGEGHEPPQSATHIYRPGLNGERELVASLGLHPSNHTTISFGEDIYELDDFFTRQGEYVLSRRVKMPLGAFVWSSTSGRPELYDAKHRLVACHRSKSRLFSKYRISVLEVSHSVAACMDLIVLGWVITMHDISLGPPRTTQYAVEEQPPPCWAPAEELPPPFTK